MNSGWTREVLKAAAKALGGKYGALGFQSPHGYRLPGYVLLGAERPGK